MKILTIHNRYKFRGGEDESREAEDALLAERGHEIRSIVFDNSLIGGLNVVRAGLRATWSGAAYRTVSQAISAWRPDILDVHNFFPLASPSVYYAAATHGVAVVQTLHNYRLLCPGALFFRDGAVCERCLGKPIPWPGVLHACYRGGHGATAAVATMATVHNFAGTWRKVVTLFVALTDFARDKFISAGFPAERIVVKPNFVPIDLGAGTGDGDYLMFVGRLSVEKGISVLLDAWRGAEIRGKLLIVGDGPLVDRVRAEAERKPSIVYLGKRPLSEVYGLMGRSRALVCPSTCYEGLPRAIIEALCRGTPVIATRLGAMSELIADGRTGWLVPPGDPVELARVMCDVAAGKIDTAPMRVAARKAFEGRYTREQNYGHLVRIYERALTLRQQGER